MKTVILSSYGEPEVLTIGDTPTPTPQAEQLLVRVKAAALNRADLLQRRGKYPPPSGESETLGLEIAGEVVGFGKDVHDFKQGDRVFGLVGGGGYAEYCCLDNAMAMRIPDRWSYTTAAAVPESFMTANETAFELGQLEKGQTILVHAGASGVGTAVIQMAHYIGATTYFTAGSEEKIQKVLTLGADHGINYKNEDFATAIAQLTHNQGVDVIEDFIGAAYLSQNLLCLKRSGRLIIVGLLGGKQAEIDLSYLLFKSLQIKSLAMRSQPLAVKRQMTARFKSRWLPVLETGAIKPIIDAVFPIEEVRQAHQHMEKNLNFGKIVLTI